MDASFIGCFSLEVRRQKLEGTPFVFVSERSKQSNLSVLFPESFRENVETNCHRNAYAFFHKDVCLFGCRKAAL